MSTSALVKRLREDALQMGHYGAHAAGVLMEQAADEIERLHAQIAQMRRDHNAEIREIERDARHAIRDAAAEDRWKAAQGDEYGSY